MIDEIKIKIEEIEDALNASCPKDTPRGKALGECFYNLGLAFMIRDHDEDKAEELAAKAYYLAVGLLETGMVKA